MRIAQFRHLWVILICWITYLPAQADIRLTSRWSSDTTSIGEPVILRLEVNLPEGFIPHFPELQIENEKVSMIETHLEPMAVEYKVAFWDLGPTTLPGIPVRIVDSYGAEKVFVTDSMLIVVASTLTGQEQDIREIKEMIPLKLRDIRSFWLRIGVMFIIVGIIAMLWRLKRKVNTNSATARGTSPEVAIQRRLKELQKITYDPKQAGRFYLLLSQVLRQYLEQRYFFRAMEMTTSEIKGILPEELHEESTVALIVQVLEISDLAKFANQHLSATQWSQDLRNVQDILERTRSDFRVAVQS